MFGLAPPPAEVDYIKAGEESKNLIYDFHAKHNMKTVFVRQP